MPSDQMSPIPGKWVDPPPKQTAGTVVAIENRTRTGAIAYLSILRFNAARGTLLAGGATYYSFVATFAILALTFAGLATVGAEEIVNWVDQVLQEFLPQLISAEGLNPETLRAAGQSAGIVGAFFFLYSGTGVINALSGGLHIIFGAPKDPRNFAWKKVRQLGWLLLLVLLLAISLTPIVLLGSIGEPIREFFGIEDSEVLHTTTSVLGYGLSFFINLLSIYLIFNFLGGIRPKRFSIVVGAIFFAAATGVLRIAMVYIVGWAVERPQYGAFAVPVAILLTYYLQWLVLFFTASLTAAVALYRGGIIAQAAEREDSKRQHEAIQAVETVDGPEYPTEIVEPTRTDESSFTSHRTEVLVEDSSPGSGVTPQSLADTEEIAPQSDVRRS